MGGGPSGSVVTNGVQGVFVNITQSSIQSSVDTLNRLWGTACTLDAFAITQLLLQSNAGPILSLLDAAAIVLGQNNHP